MRRVPVLAGMLLLLPGVVAAQQFAADAKDERLRALEERVRTLETELAAIKEALKTTRGVALVGGTLTLASASLTPAAPAMDPAPSLVPVLGQDVTAAQLPNYGGAGTNAKALNPDISVIGDFLGAAGKNPLRPVPTLEMHESEVGFQAVIDPYARGDFFLSFGETGVSLEEGYLTLTSLPGGFVAKVGKMRAAFGKVNTIHNHALEWTDRPMVTDNLIGGEDGISDSGLSITRILPAPKGLFLEATGQIFRGDSGNLFRAARKQDVSWVGHLRGYKDITESTNMDLGFSYARGHSAPLLADGSDVALDSHTDLFGLDATFRWKPLRRAIYHSFLARTELVWSRREQLPFDQHAFGFFTSAEYRLNRRWTVGGRFDRTGRASAADLTDTGFSALLTYWPSEFSQLRGQYRFARYPEGRDANELRFQFLFVLGAHGAHPF